MFTPNGPIDHSEIINFENSFQVNLSEDYRNFLQQTNGGTFEGVLLKTEKLGDLLIDCLFGLNLQAQLNLQFWNQELKNEIPEKSTIIGSDAGGGFLLLYPQYKESNVFYYDHAYSFPTSSDEENTYLLADRFSKFFQSLNYQ
jgi:hypothetical protein